MTFIKREYIQPDEISEARAKINELKSLAEEAFSDSIARVSKKRDDMIMSAFAKKGFLFDSDRERDDFFKSRVTGITNTGNDGDDLIHLYVDDIHICTYGQFVSANNPIVTPDNYTVGYNITFQFSEAS